jgi:hypothetical protein
MRYDDALFSPPAPVARVSLRNPQTGVVMTDVLMLIDSGADTTLVPQAAAQMLGLDLSSGSRYELEGFDGSKSIAQTAQLESLLLRYTFTGRYLLIEQEYGIIGRDILNYLSLLLDGPRLAWDVRQPPAV